MFREYRMPLSPPKVWGYRSRLCIAVVCLAAQLCWLVGCGNKTQGVELADAGQKTSATLADYYDSLAQDTLDTWELEAFNSSIRGVPFDHASQQAYQDQLQALKRRAAVARQFAGVYGALKDLASYDASGEVQTAASGLAKSLTGLPPLKGSGVDPSSLFGSLTGDIAGQEQSRDIRRSSAQLLQHLQAVSNLFQREAPAYRSITEERDNKMNDIISYLIQHKMVVAWPLLQKVPDTFGLPWAGSNQPASDSTTIAAMIQVAQVRTQRLAFDSDAATDSMGHSVQLLVGNDREFLAQRGLNLADLGAALQRAQTYLDEIAALRAAAPPPTAAAPPLTAARRAAIQHPPLHHVAPSGRSPRLVARH